jgi:peptidyl-dipeptidase A
MKKSKSAAEQIAFAHSPGRTMRHLLTSAAALMLAAATPSCAQTRHAKPVVGGGAPSVAEAVAFVDKAEKALAGIGVYANKAQWVYETYINDDTSFLTAKAGAESTELGVKYAKEARRFDHTNVDPVTRRKLTLLKIAVTLPAPDRPGASQESADLQARLTTLYATGTATIDGKALHIDELGDAIAVVRDPQKSKEIWEKWHQVAMPMKGDYVKLTALLNEGAQGLGYKDAGVLWRAGYDTTPDQFAALTDRLWEQVKPFYTDLHCYVRTKLNEKYGDTIQPKTGPIRADLLGNMWAQEWGNIYDVVAPKDGHGLGYDLTKQLEAKGYTPQSMVKTAEAFYVSLGFDPWPKSFWERSMIARPRDREVQCHASAWDIDNADDIRLKACIHVTADDFFTVHHELGHNLYQRAYKNQPFLFKSGANDGFHEAIGDFAGLNALTPGYLKRLGLIDTEPGNEADIPYLLKVAMDGIAFLPFGLLVDKWRWEVFSGEVKPADYNKAWWDLKLKYQGVIPPGPRPPDAFDPGAKNHIATSVPYARYFLARIYEYQFYRAACREAGWMGPLNRCAVYGNRAVGASFARMLEMGQSRPWQEALQVFTGEKDIDASAVADYFAPLDRWLKEQNKANQCGW